MAENTRSQSSSGLGSKSLIQMVMVVMAALGAGGGGSWLATNGIESSVETTIQTRLTAIETKIEGWNDQLINEINDVDRRHSEKAATLERKIERIEEDLRQSEQDSKLTDIHLELLGKINELGQSLSDRLTRLEATRRNMPRVDRTESSNSP